MRAIHTRVMMSVYISIIVCLVSAGCSVKEYRDTCPCRLMLDFSGVDTSIVKTANVLAVYSDGRTFSDAVPASMFSEVYVREISRGHIRFTIWGGEGVDEQLLIPYGCECPPLYMHAFDADVSGESFYEKVGMKKNHCCLKVLFDGKQEMPYSLTFRGNVDGYRTDGMPSTGDFACVAYPLDAGGSQVVVPRQTDSSLLLDVEDEDISVLKTFAIGELLRAGGYDWNAEELEDATVILDYYVTGIKITYKGWDKEYTYDIIL